MSRLLLDFEDLGFPRPPNMNPADFIMDVLGGEIRHVEGRTIDFQARNATLVSRAVFSRVNASLY